MNEVIALINTFSDFLIELLKCVGILSILVVIVLFVAWVVLSGITIIKDFLDDF